MVVASTGAAGNEVRAGLEKIAMKTRVAAASIAVMAYAFMANAANATPFTVTGVSLSPGSGYGIDGSESSGTLLDVRFSTAGFTTQNFNLNAAGDFTNFIIGTADLEESNAMGGINSNETDNLGVTAHFTFTNPLSGISDVIATGTATTGAVSDAAVDFTLNWTPILLNFGASGQFSLTLDALSLDGMGPQNLNARLSLVSADQSIGISGEATPVPEPATLALFGAGLVGLGAPRRRKARA